MDIHLDGYGYTLPKSIWIWIDLCSHGYPSISIHSELCLQLIAKYLLDYSEVSSNDVEPRYCVNAMYFLMLRLL